MKITKTGNINRCKYHFECDCCGCIFDYSDYTNMILGAIDEAYSELDMLNADREELIYSYAADDTIFDLSYIMEKLRAREIDSDEKAQALITLAIGFIIRNRPLKWE